VRYNLTASSTACQLLCRAPLDGEPLGTDTPSRSRRAVKATGGKQLVFAGVITEGWRLPLLLRGTDPVAERPPTIKMGEISSAAIPRGSWWYVE
jgi:hypothetical protein